MKIKKILPILVLALAAMFVLAGCNQILENLFPNETGHGTTVTNNSTLNVQAYLWTDPNYVSYPWGSDGYSKVDIDLIDNSNHTVVAHKEQYAGKTTGYQPDYTYTDIYYHYLAGRYPVTVTFPAVADGNYTVRVWLDTDETGVWDPAEFYQSNQDYSGRRTADFYNNGWTSNISLSGMDNKTIDAYIDYYDYEGAAVGMY